MKFNTAYDDYIWRDALDVSDITNKERWTGCARHDSGVWRKEKAKLHSMASDADIIMVRESWHWLRFFVTEVGKDVQCAP